MTSNDKGRPGASPDNPARDRDAASSGADSPDPHPDISAGPNAPGTGEGGAGRDPDRAGASDRFAGGPTAIALARLNPRAGFPPGGERIYRHIMQLVELKRDHEFVVVPCGRGTAAIFVATSSGASGAGTDPTADLVDKATSRARYEKLADRLHFEHAPMDSLPYKDDIFDFALGDIALSAAIDPRAAVRELVRVTKSMGTVLLIQPVWTRAVEDDRRRMLVEHMGLQPFLPVEWKQMLRNAGVVDLHVEDWSDILGDLRRPVTLGRLSGFVSWGERLSILYRAWRRWGLRGAKEAVQRERRIRDLVKEERVLGISVIKGTKWRE